MFWEMLWLPLSWENGKKRVKNYFIIEFFLKFASYLIKKTTNFMKKLLLLFTISIGFSYSAKSQIVFNENFDGSGPGIAGWTLYDEDGLTVNTNVSYITNAWISRAYDFDNNVAMSTSWYSAAGTSNDWMVSPAITLPAGVNTLYWDGIAFDPAFSDSYKVYISTTGNTPSDFDTELLNVDPEESDWTRHTIDLSDYSGQTVYIAFQNYSFDMYLLALDNIAIINNDACFAPDREMSTNVTTTSATIAWTGGTGDFDVAIGAPGFTPTTPTGTANTETYTASSLTPDTRYQYYVRSQCGSNWIGPYSIFTARTLPYTYGFETIAGYTADGWAGSWTLNNATPSNGHTGNQMVFSNVAATATNRSIFTKAISLAAGEQVTTSFWHRETSATVNRNLRLRVVNQATPAVSTVIYTVSNIHNTTWSQVTAPVFTAPSAGIYFFEFNDFSPAAAAASSMLLDDVVFNTNLATNSFNESKLAVYPNPTSNLINISNELGAVINTVEMTDLNGRVVKSAKVNATEGQISISDLAAGVYMMRISTDQGTAVKKVVKQ